MVSLPKDRRRMRILLERMLNRRYPDLQWLPSPLPWATQVNGYERNGKRVFESGFYRLVFDAPAIEFEMYKERGKYCLIIRAKDGAPSCHRKRLAEIFRRNPSLPEPYLPRV